MLALQREKNGRGEHRGRVGQNLGEGKMLRIQRSENGEVAFALSGQLDKDAIAELEALINAEASGRRIVLNLKNLTMVDEDDVIFLERCESNSITLEHCPPYIREWINRQRQGD